MNQYTRIQTPKVNMLILPILLFSSPLYTYSNRLIGKYSQGFGNAARNNTQPCQPGNHPRTQQAKAVSEKELNTSYIIHKGVNNGF